MSAAKLTCSNEAADLAGAAGTREHQAPPQTCALAKMVRTSWIYGQEKGGDRFLKKVK